MNILDLPTELYIPVYQCLGYEELVMFAQQVSTLNKQSSSLHKSIKEIFTKIYIQYLQYIAESLPESASKIRILITILKKDSNEEGSKNLFKQKDFEAITLNAAYFLGFISPNRLKNLTNPSYSFIPSIPQVVLARMKSQEVRVRMQPLSQISEVITMLCKESMWIKAKEVTKKVQNSQEGQEAVTTYIEQLCNANVSKKAKEIFKRFEESGESDISFDSIISECEYVCPKVKKVELQLSRLLKRKDFESADQLVSETMRSEPDSEYIDQLKNKYLCLQTEVKKAWIKHQPSDFETKINRLLSEGRLEDAKNACVEAETNKLDEGILSKVANEIIQKDSPERCMNWAKTMEAKGEITEAKIITEVIIYYFERNDINSAFEAFNQINESVAPKQRTRDIVTKLVSLGKDELARKFIINAMNRGIASSYLDECKKALRSFIDDGQWQEAKDWILTIPLVRVGALLLFLINELIKFRVPQNSEKES